MFSWLFGKKEQELTADIIAKLNNLPPQLLAQAQTLKQNGDSKLFDKLVEIAGMEQQPEKPGFFGKLTRSVGKAFGSSLSTAAIGGLTFAGVTYAMGNIDATDEMIGAAPTDAQQENAINAAINAKAAIGDTTPLTEVERADAIQGVTEGATNVAINRGLTSFGVITAFGTVMRSITNWSAIDVEAQQEQMIWNMMNNPQNAQMAAAPAYPAPSMANNIQVPRGLPTQQTGAGYQLNA